jgi:hypothetical protein
MQWWPLGSGLSLREPRNDGLALGFFEFDEPTKHIDARWQLKLLFELIESGGFVGR